MCPATPSPVSEVYVNITMHTSVQHAGVARLGRVPQAHNVLRAQKQQVLQAQNVLRAQKQQQSGSNILIPGLVSAITESLRLLGIGKQQYQQIAQQASAAPLLPPGDVQGVMERITGDFQRLYFVTGVIDDSIYDETCTFVDPTVKFSGLDLWKRNLQLLVPFLIQPDVQLLSLTQLGKNADGAEQLQAEWTLKTMLSLPWRPFISILGRTVYTLNADANQVIEHVEYWNVSAAQALLQMIRPGAGNDDRS